MPKTTQTKTREFKSQMFTKWAPVARETELSGRPRSPAHILKKEAQNAAATLLAKWEPAFDLITRAQIHPGFSSANTKTRTRIEKKLATEINELLAAIDHCEYLQIRQAAEVERGVTTARIEEMVLELEAVMAFFAHGEQGDTLAQYEAYESAHENFRGSRTRALQALGAIAELVHEHRDEIKTYPDFSPQVLTEALAISDSLNGTVTADPQETNEEKLPRELRDQLFVLLQQRVSEIREVARFVFRKHPDILRKITSEYERRRRAAQRAKTSEQERNQGSSEDEQDEPAPPSLAALD